MPTIRKISKKKYVQSAKNKDISKIYGSYQWQILRECYYMEHPLCEMCLEQGIVKPAEEVHHITPISKGRNFLEMRDLAYNAGNLMSLCKECHHKLHNHNKSH